MRKNISFILISFLLVLCVPACVQAAEEVVTTTVMQAVVKEDLPALAELVKQDIKIDEQDKTGTTPLIYAAKKGKVFMTDVLVQLGASPTVTDKQGMTAIDWAEKGEEDIRTLDASVKIGEILKSSVTKPFAKKRYQRILFDLENGTLAVLNCDDLTENEDVVFCQIKIGDNSIWELYTPGGNYIDRALDMEKVSHNGKEYFILKKWGEYSILLPSGIPLREHLKQVKHSVDRKTGALVFKIKNAQGQKENFAPGLNLRNPKKNFF